MNYYKGLMRDFVYGLQGVEKCFSGRERERDSAMIELRGFGQVRLQEIAGSPGFTNIFLFGFLRDHGVNITPQIAHRALNDARPHVDEHEITGALLNLPDTIAGAFVRERLNAAREETLFYTRLAQTLQEDWTGAQHDTTQTNDPVMLGDPYFYLPSGILD